MRTRHASFKTRHHRSLSTGLTALAGVVALSVAPIDTAHPLSIELKDAAPERIELQQDEALGRLPLAGTPDMGLLPQRLAAAGIKKGAPIFIRIFKESSELEVWMKKSDQYTLFATYPMCQWSGTLGPKFREGDKQTPEGFYTVTRSQLRRRGRWRNSINLGYPNAFDRANKRTGSYILMHGGCSSVGCFAMTNPVMKEVYQLTRAASYKGQRYIPVHVMPFRMTPDNLVRHAGSPWMPFWEKLAEASRAFEATRVPPKITVCDGRYVIEPAVLPEQAAEAASTPAAKKKAANINRRRALRWPGPIYKHCPRPKLLETSSITTNELPTKKP